MILQDLFKMDRVECVLALYVIDNGSVVVIRLS